MTKLSIDVLFRSGKLAAALAIAHADRELLTEHDRRAIAVAFEVRCTPPG